MTTGPFELITSYLVRRDGTSWGFSIVGGAEPGSERTEPVHVLFVVPESPAAKVGVQKLQLRYDGKRESCSLQLCTSVRRVKQPG